MVMLVFYYDIVLEKKCCCFACDLPVMVFTV